MFEPSFLLRDLPGKRFQGAGTAIAEVCALLLDDRPASGLRCGTASPNVPLLPPALVMGLVAAVRDLASGSRDRDSVRVSLGGTPWEIGLTRSGDSVLISVAELGPLPGVLVFERPVRGAGLAERLQAVVERIDAPDRAIALAREELDLAARVETWSGRVDAPPTLVSVDPAGELSCSISAELALRSPAQTATAPGAQRAEITPLLFTGKIRLTMGEHVRELPDVHVFLVAEQLARCTFDLLHAATAGRPMSFRTRAGGALLAVRLQGAEEAPPASRRDAPPSIKPCEAAITLAPPEHADSTVRAFTFPRVDVDVLAGGVAAFGRALVRSLLRRDRSFAQNLRVLELRARLRAIAEHLRDRRGSEAKVNDAPESYRAFAALLDNSSKDAASSPAVAPSRLRFSQTWSAAMPCIDLRATHLAGDALLVGSTREIACIHRESGELVWKRAVSRGISILTPAGLVRLDADGRLRLFALDHADEVWSLKLAPRTGGPVSGCVVALKGLPRMLLVTEGRRSVVAVDLDSGEVRWRYRARRGGTFRLRRAGRLVVIGSGETALTALDLLHGEVVWRTCDPFRFSAPVSVSGDALFAVAGDGAFPGRGGMRLYHLDPCSGEVRFTSPIRVAASPVAAPLVAEETVVVTTHGRCGTGISAFDRRTGELAFSQTITAGAASSILVDDAVVVNDDSGELTAVSARDGRTLYRRRLASATEGDRPRFLEPVLRSGALFVPQSYVHVIRPRDGVEIGKLPTDLVPDLVRVDERCNVYVVEESGHLAAFAAGPRLHLVPL